jgi:integrase
MFAHIRDAAGLDKKLSLHCLRHTLASALIVSGVDIPTVQRIGGWATPDILLQVYAHSNDDAARNALEKVVF